MVDLSEGYTRFRLSQKYPTCSLNDIQSDKQEALFDGLLGNIHHDLLYSFNFAIKNFSILLNQFHKYTKEIHFDDINDKVMSSLSTEYDVSLRILDEKRRKQLIKKKDKFINKNSFDNIDKKIVNSLKCFSRDNIGQILYVLYINLFEEEMKKRLAKLKASDNNEQYKKLEDEFFDNFLVSKLLEQEDLGQDNLFLFPILSKIDDEKLLLSILHNFVGTREKELISIFKKEVKGREYVSSESSLDLFGMMSYYKNRGEMRDSFNILLRRAFVYDPKMIHKITNQGVIKFNRVQDRLQHIDDVSIGIDVLEEAEELLNIVKEKKQNVLDKTFDTLTVFEVFLFRVLDLFENYLVSEKESYDKNIIKKEFKELCDKNIFWLDSGQKQHNTFTNKSTSPFINVTLNIDGNYVEKQGRIVTSSSMSSILQKYHSYFSIGKVQNPLQMNVYRSLVAERKEKLKSENLKIRKQIDLKWLRIKSFYNKSDTKENQNKLVRFKLQLMNKIKYYLIHKIILSSGNNLSQIIFDILNKKGDNKDILAMLDSKDLQHLQQLFLSIPFQGYIDKECKKYHSKNFLSINIDEAKADLFLYDIINNCSELEHPIYKWKIEFEAGAKYYLSSYSQQKSFKFKHLIESAILHKLYYIVDKIYNIFIMTDYDRSSLAQYYKGTLDDYLLFFDMDEELAKNIIAKVVIQEFLNNNKFIDECISSSASKTPNTLEFMVRDVVDFLKSYL